MTDCLQLWQMIMCIGSIGSEDNSEASGNVAVKSAGSQEVCSCGNGSFVGGFLNSFDMVYTAPS